MYKHKIGLATIILVMVLQFYSPSLLQTSAASTNSTNSQEPFPEIALSITVNETDVPSYQVLVDESLVSQQVSATPVTRQFPGQLSMSNHQLAVVDSTAAATDLVDNWEMLLEEDFEATFLQNGCSVYDKSGDNLERKWGKNDLRSAAGTWAGWPASDGEDSLNPAVSKYPANMNTWLICGPYDLSNAQDFLVKFARWLDISDTDDHFFAGVSTDGNSFQGVEWSGVENWVTQQLWFQGVAGSDNVWVGWQFESDVDNDLASGVWLDTLEVWRYNTPTQACGSLDPGAKGIVLHPYEWINNVEYPIIRAGDTIAADKLAVAGAHWVRIVFQERGGLVRQQEYDRMVDTLCAKGMSVLGVINHETLVRQDYNDETTAAAYQQEFSGAAEFTAKRFAGRITYWEVWNEPNLAEGPYVDPVRYAPLLNDTSQAIKSVNSQAQIVFGGLASAWEDSSLYFQQVYGWLGTAKPFDYFAVHPYARVAEGPNPQVYMYADQHLGYTTIVDKFMQTMATNNDANKHVWITEVGWNSSKDSPTRPTCLDPVLVYESEQAAYLKPMFDILFDEVTLWSSPGTPAVDKVVWYQYMDTGITDPCASGQTSEGHVYVDSHDMITAGAVDWWFGLYRGDKKTPKETWCSYRAYPLTCDEFFSHHVHLPLIIRD